MIMHVLADRTFETLDIGMKASFLTQFEERDLQIFGSLTSDQAPVHLDQKYAQSMGYKKPISYGLMVASQFSGLLGMVLPGPRSVIHSLSFVMKKPVYTGEELTYTAEIKRIVKSVRVVILDLTVSRGAGEVVLRGETQCGFLR